MSKRILSEAQQLISDIDREFLLQKINPISEKLIEAARKSPKYKGVLDQLNTLDKTIPVKVSISLSGRNFNRFIASIEDNLKENTQKLVKEITGHIFYVTNGQKLEDPPIFKKIVMSRDLDLSVGDIPILQNKLSILHVLTLEVLQPNPNPKIISSPPTYKKYEVYGNLPIKEAYDYIYRRVKEEEEEDKKDLEQQTATKPAGNTQDIQALPFDKQLEFINLPKTQLDLTGPFLLKWSQQA